MNIEDFDKTVRVVVVGNGSVGKSSLIRRFIKNQYNETYKKTIGVDYQERMLILPESTDCTSKQSVKVMVWDCAGQEDFDQITKEYYKEADAVILAFSTTDRKSFEMVKGWKAKLETALAMSDVVAVLLQNKVDEQANAQVSPQEAEALARELRLRFYRVSVKENVQVEDVFVYLAQAHLLKQKGQTIKSPADSHLMQKAELFKQDANEPPHVEPTTRRTGGKKEKCCIQ